MSALRVATLNIRNLADRLAERQGLLFADMAYPSDHLRLGAHLQVGR